MPLGKNRLDFNKTTHEYYSNTFNKEGVQSKQEQRNHKISDIKESKKHNWNSELELN